MGIERIESAIRDVIDFPKSGIVFKDITPVLQSAGLFREVIDIMCESYLDNHPDFIVGIESRGFIFGAAMAFKLNCGFIPVRKKGKLPYETIEESYALEYGTATIEMHVDALRKGNKVVIIDDLLATGGTAEAAVKLVNHFGAEILGIDFLIELVFLNGRAKLADYPVNTLIKVD